MVDYKTGKGAQYADIEGDDPFLGGTALQLGLYSEAAVQQLGASDPSAFYWMVDGGSEAKQRGYRWNGPRREAFVGVITAIVDGIEAGMFAAQPGGFDNFRGKHENCRFCDFDEVCTRDRGDQELAKIDAPELRVRDRLSIDLSVDVSATADVMPAAGS